MKPTLKDVYFKKLRCHKTFKLMLNEVNAKWCGNRLKIKVSPFAIRDIKCSQNFNKIYTKKMLNIHFSIKGFGIVARAKYYFYSIQRIIDNDRMYHEFPARLYSNNYRLEIKWICNTKFGVSCSLPLNKDDFDEFVDLSIHHQVCIRFLFTNYNRDWCRGYPIVIQSPIKQVNLLPFKRL